MIQKIFVYGSLLEGLFNWEKYLKEKVLTRKPARTKGELFHLVNAGYPAMIEGSDYVYGELIEVKDYEETIKDLDRLENYFGEGNPENEYNRRTISVEVIEDGCMELAGCYMYNLKSRESLRKEDIYLKDGDWRKFYRESVLTERALA